MSSLSSTTTTMTDLGVRVENPPQLFVAAVGFTTLTCIFVPFVCVCVCEDSRQVPNNNRAPRGGFSFSCRGTYGDFAILSEWKQKRKKKMIMATLIWWMGLEM